MILNTIGITNYRSIEKLDFSIEKVNETFTFSLLGINESGKSSFIRAISLFNEDTINFPLDFFDPSKQVEVLFDYSLSPVDIAAFRKQLEVHKFPKELISQIVIKNVLIGLSYQPTNGATRLDIENVNLEAEVYPEYTLVDDVLVKKGKSDEQQEDFSLREFLNDNLENYFWDKSHSVTFWESSPSYLIVDEIDLAVFAATPKKVSIPLFNCFQLAGISGATIQVEIGKLTDAVSTQNLQDRLSDVVTKHIKTVWPEHPISIKFHINSNKLSFLVEDDGIKYSAKTTNQRSDGFKQFISFLLTISVENFNQELSDSILLLDEPETHLHPKAQINLMKELIKITKHNKNNIVFFATHSNYMIDKDNMERCYKVEKKSNRHTELSRINNSSTSYSEVNYDIFGIPTSDYHNELYGFLEDTDKTKLDGLTTDKDWVNDKSGKTEKVSLSKFIRNSIHHPENTKNKKFSEKDLETSIGALRKLKYGKQ